MSVKKLIILAAASIVTSAALAGGPDHMSMPVQPMFQPQFYIDANVGYAQANWQGYGLSVFGDAASLPGASVTNGHGGFTGGGDVGYRFTRYLGVELGAYYLPKAKTTGGTDVVEDIPVTVGANVSNWFAYFAAKLSIPFFADGLDLFGKAGVAYRSLDNSVTASVEGYSASAVEDDQFWAPTFGLGLQYFITQNWSVNGQWMYVGGYANENPLGRQAPVTNLFTVGAGYQFAV